MDFELIVHEGDFTHQLEQNPALQEKLGRKELVLGDESKGKDEIVKELMPSVIAQKISRIIPDNYKVNEIQMSIKLGGKVFGVELAGNIIVKFGPQ